MEEPPPGSPCPGMFQDWEIEILRADLFKFLIDVGLHVEWGCVAGQPFWLGLFKGLLVLTDDVDAALPDLLRDGVKTGVLDDLAPSGVFALRTRANDVDDVDCEITCCDANWQSAETDFS